jgi:RNA polymerase sigma-70 factor (ECF subfamily)
MVLNEHTPVPTQPPGTDSLDFTTFMRSYQDMVFTTAARLSGNDAQAQDIAQEVFVRAYQHFAELSGSASAGGWLKTVATNLSINYLNRYRKRWRMFSDLRGTDDDESAPEIDWPAPDDLLMDLSAEQRQRSVDAALKQLPPRQRLPLVLYHFEELSYQDIAAQLGCSLAKVKTDIRRARAALLPLLRQLAAHDTLEA